MGQVPSQQLVFIARVSSQRPHHRKAAALGCKHARYMQKRLGGLRTSRQTELCSNLVFFVQAKTKFKQLGLCIANQPGQRNRSPYIRQRIVRSLMQQAVGSGQVFQLETGPRSARSNHTTVGGFTVFGLARPHNAVWPQRISHPHHILNVPTSTVVLPFACVRLHQIAPEQMARHFIVKTNRVVAYTHSARCGQQAFNFCSKFVFRHTAL